MPKRLRRRSDRLVAGHAELDELGVQAPAVLASDADLRRPLRLAVPGRVAHGPRDSAHEEEDPPESHEPSSDSREDPADHERVDPSYLVAEDSREPSDSPGGPICPGMSSKR